MWGTLILYSSELGHPPTLRELKQKQNFRNVANSMQGGFFFHPSDKDLSLGARLRKNPLSGRGLRGAPQLKIEMWGTLILYSSELGQRPRGDFHAPLWLEKPRTVHLLRGTPIAKPL